MLYIHKLPDLNMKSAEIESISVIRELRIVSHFPVSEEFMNSQLTAYFARADELKMMGEALALIPFVSEQLVRLLAEKNEVHEPINVYRSIQLLKQIQQPLQNNLAYVSQLDSAQAQLAGKMTELINKIPGMAAPEDISAVNEALSSIFENLLRSKSMVFNCYDIINESHTGIANGLLESMRNGYLFHVTLEEEMKKADFARIQLHILREKLDEAEAIRQNILTIKKGVDAAYNVNMKTVELAVLLYSMIKWASARQYA
jgi:hypothetical protein